ncbi:MAG: L,D-transpeptidase family protein [Clostridia bacterium]|nr:L,D-transpeptidase family protein [Clostridia bacterium]
MKKLLLLLLICLLPCLALAEDTAWVSVPEVIRPGKAMRLSFTAPEGTVSNVTVMDDGVEIAHPLWEAAVRAGENAFSWDGLDNDGYALPGGVYTLHLQAGDASATRTVAIGEPAPMILSLNADSQVTYSRTIPWQCEIETSMDGTLTLALASEDGEETILSLPVTGGHAALTWDGRRSGHKLDAGWWDITLRLTDNTGFSSTPEMISVEVVSPALATDVSYFTPDDFSGVTCGHDVCYWKLNMGELDEGNIWQVLTQPVTVLNGDERKQIKIRKEPDDDCTDYVGEVTCMSQAVHVLQRGDKWTLIEAYSSSVEGSKVKAWATQFQGYVETSLLKERQVDQHLGIVIDKLQQRLYIFQDGQLFSTLLCSTGYPNNGAPWNETPAGEFLAVSWAGGFWAGDLYCDMGIRINDGILLHEVPCLIEIDEKTGEEERDYDRCERYLGEKASHGCIRIQRAKSPEGASIRWLWDNMSRESSARTKVIIWDELGRILGYPDSDVTLYYNPNGGRNYHSHAYCQAVNDRFLPLSPFLYGELDEDEYDGLTPCGACAPQLRMEAIDNVNAENYR